MNAIPKRQVFGTTRSLTQTAMLGAIATVLMYLELPIPFLPPFLKLDISGIPVLLAGFMLSPMQGVAVALIKDMVHLLSTQTGGVGELADFLIMSSFILAAAFIYKRSGSMVKACVVGSVAMVATGVVANLYLLIPFYSKIMPIDAIIAACNAVNPYVTGIEGYVLLGVVPFNLLKAVVISALAIASAKRLKPIFSR